MNRYIEISPNRFYCVYPNECPMCNSKISPDCKDKRFNKVTNCAGLFFECPSCGKFFVTHYSYNPDNPEAIRNGTYNYNKLNLEQSFPVIPKKIEFNESIENLSPTFCDIYNQSSSAETYNLNQIAGMGYRKALEFLIKDYCIYRHNNDEQKIKSMFLSQVIEKYVDSDKIKNLSKVSAWLGNDETHYVKKFDDKDINDLKKFINATVYFISYDLVSDTADDLVSSK